MTRSARLVGVLTTPVRAGFDGVGVVGAATPRLPAEDSGAASMGRGSRFRAWHGGLNEGVF